MSEGEEARHALRRYACGLLEDTRKIWNNARVYADPRSFLPLVVIRKHGGKTGAELKAEGKC
jgi:hypothetical protein